MNRQLAALPPAGRKFIYAITVGLLIVMFIFFRNACAPPKPQGKTESPPEKVQVESLVSQEEALQPEPKREDIKVEVVELKPTSEGMAVKVVVSNVGTIPARVLMWPYITLSDGEKVSRSLLQGPVVADAESGKKTVVMAPVRLTERQMLFVKSGGVEDISISRLEGAPLTPQIPGFLRRPGHQAESSSAADTKTAFLIVPGKSLGPIRLGMIAEEAMKVGGQVWGEEPEYNTALGVVINWEKLKVVANAGGPPGAPEKVFSIRTTNPRFRTRAGVCIGSRYAAAKKSLGKTNFYDKMPGLGARAGWPSGLWMDIDTSGRIVTIGMDE